MGNFFAFFGEALKVELDQFFCVRNCLFHGISIRRNAEFRNERGVAIVVCSRANILLKNDLKR